MKHLPKQFWIGLGLGLVILIAIAANPAFTDFNSNQFSVTGNKVAIKSGALQTNGAFSGTLTLNGSPVLTNATGGDTIWTNYFLTNVDNVISVVDSVTLPSRLQFAVRPDTGFTFMMLGNTTPDLNELIQQQGNANSELYGFGDLPFPSIAITNSFDIYGVGFSPFDSAILQSAGNVYGFGYSPFVSANMDGPSSIYSFGDSGFSGAFVTNSNYLLGFGSFLFQDAILDNADKITAYGDQCFVSSTFQRSSDTIGIGSGAFGNSIVTNSTFLFGFGVTPFDGATITNSTALFGLGDAIFQNANIIGGDSIFAYGVRALASANLTNSSDIYVFGTDAGGGNSTPLSGDSLTHIFILGSGGTATNSNDFVFGDSAYNYFFPGASATFAAVPTVNGVPLLTNATGGTQVWTNDDGIYPVSPIVLVRPRTDNTENLGTNGLRWLNIWSYGLDVDGDIRVSGNISPRDVPYIWPVTQGDTNTILVNDGTGVLSWEPRTNAPVSGVTENVTTLGWSGTNITGFNCATNFQGYYLLATNNFHFGSSTFSNLPTKTQLRNFTLCIQMDSTGGRIGSFTNSIVGWSLGSTNAPFIETNANAVSYVYFHTDMTTNSTLVATFNMDVRR